MLYVHQKYIPTNHLKTMLINDANDKKYHTKVDLIQNDIYIFYWNVFWSYYGFITAWLTLFLIVENKAHLKKITNHWNLFHLRFWRLTCAIIHIQSKSFCKDAIYEGLQYPKKLKLAVDFVSIHTLSCFFSLLGIESFDSQLIFCRFIFSLFAE